MHILNFGTQLQAGGGINVRPGIFFGHNTILDADMIFLNIQSIYSSMGGKSNEWNSISDKQKAAFETGISLRKEEFKEYFNIGRTLVITSPIFLEYKYQIVEESQKVTLDIWECLDIDAPECSDNSGRNIETLDEPYAKTFFQDFGDLLYYNKRIDKSKGNPLFFIKDTKYVVGEYYRVGNGLILILPEFGPPSEARVRSFVDSLTALSTNLLRTAASKLPQFPEMVNQYVTKEELQERAKLTTLVEKQQVLEEKVKHQNSILEDFKWMKLLFSSDGDLLEHACARIIEQLGFEVERPAANRHDLIIKQANYIAVVEVKGVTKSAAEKHSAQLQKWVSDYHLANGQNPKGILIANTFRNLPLNKRTEDDFPDQMMKYVNQMGHCLISGIQLLIIYIDFRNKKLKKNDVLKILFETVGEVTYTENRDDYILKIEAQ